jgi:hypothetical protein
MSYRVYSGPKGTSDISPLEKQKMLFKQFNAFDEARAWAAHLARTGRVPLLIDGDDGTRMDRIEIAEALGIGALTQAGH